ncbi:hypothetical protein ABL78_5881 [Leptomonas seymouri]|uniref:Uncharacterized protein n=1 Tax=Leptomonas seymouri TaxID=5684 RepID=A0A0N0P4A7_LEPSE|nr:hypothetical protein ABL78_5881 [Leptomonas seymouri]|eukprot:KPI85076.1 hypothetical protein ABL78_5881 [Leptomonas seymouri]
MPVGRIRGGSAAKPVLAECEVDFSVRVTVTSVARRVKVELRGCIEVELLPATREEFPEVPVELVGVLPVSAFRSPEECEGAEAGRRNCG